MTENIYVRYIHIELFFNPHGIIIFNFHLLHLFTQADKFIIHENIIIYVLHILHEATFLYFSKEMYMIQIWMIISATNIYNMEKE